jgi:hypothetical protein
MQNREELKGKGHDRSRKMMCRDRGKGEGINIVIGLKYRPVIGRRPEAIGEWLVSFRERVVQSLTAMR